MRAQLSGGRASTTAIADSDIVGDTGNATREGTFMMLPS
jgi:hypothetical protein